MQRPNLSKDDQNRWNGYMYSQPSGDRARRRRRRNHLDQEGPGNGMPCDPKLRYHFTAGRDGKERDAVSQTEEDDRATHWKLYSPRGEAGRRSEMADPRLEIAGGAKLLWGPLNQIRVR